MSETSEYKKEIGIAGAIAVIAALGVGLFTIVAFPINQSTPIQPGGIPYHNPIAGYASAKGVSCSLSSGACLMTLVNNSTIPLNIAGCNMPLVLNYTSNPAPPRMGVGINGTMTWHTVNGTVGGPAAAGIPAGSSYTHGSSVPGSCTMPTSELSFYASGYHASGVLFVKLSTNWYNYPAGTLAVIDFEGTWS